MDDITKAKNAVALATANVVRRRIDLRIAERALEAADIALEKVLGRGMGDGGSVYLVSCGPHKIDVIKQIREITNLGLKEAKDLSDRASDECSPDNFIGAFSSEKVKDVASRLRAAGAVIKILSTE